MIRKVFIILILIIIFNFCLSSDEIKPETYQLDIISRWPVIAAIDSEYCYIVNNDIHEINVYSLKDMKLIYKFGRKGEGPGEFMCPIKSLTSLKSKLFISECGRAHYFDKSGNLLYDKKYHPKYGRLKPIGDNFVCQNYGGMPTEKDAGKRFQIYRFVLLNSRFEEIKEISKFKLPSFTMYNYKKQKTVIDFFYNSVGNFVYKNRIYIGVSYEDKEVYEIFDKDGELIKYKRIKIEKREVLEREKQETLILLRDFFKEKIFRRNIYKFREYYPSFAKIYINSGRIYLIEYPYLDFVRIRVRDMNFKLIGIKDIKIRNPIINYVDIYIYNDTIYYLSDNEKTEKWELKVFKLNLK